MRRRMDDPQTFTDGAERSTARGLIAGLAAGLAATWVMTRFQTAMSTATEHLQDDDEGGQGGEAETGDSEPATAQAAEAVSEHVFAHPLTGREKQRASSAVHYGFGTLAGGLYGILAERSPAFATGAGLGFGTALWLSADEIGVPLAGLSAPPQEVPVSTHAQGLAAHLVYGLTADVIRRGIRRVL